MAGVHYVNHEYDFRMNWMTREAARRQPNRAVRESSKGRKNFESM